MKVLMTFEKLPQLLVNIRKMVGHFEKTTNLSDYQICFGRLIWIDIQEYLNDYTCKDKGQLKLDELIDGDDFLVIKKSTNEIVCKGNCDKMLEYSNSDDIESIDDILNIR